MSKLKTVDLALAAAAMREHADLRRRAQLRRAAA